MRRGNHASVWAETEFLNIATAHISLFNIVGQTQRASRRDWTYRGSFLKLVDTSPLQGKKKQGTNKDTKFSSNHYI